MEPSSGRSQRRSREEDMRQRLARPFLCTLHPSKPVGRDTRPAFDCAGMETVVARQLTCPFFLSLMKGEYDAFLSLMKGEYDALLQWPFRHTVTLTLGPKWSKEHHSLVHQTRAHFLFFPETQEWDEHSLRQSHVFAPLLLVLNNSSYVKDDTMFLKCQIATKWRCLFTAN